MKKAGIKKLGRFLINGCSLIAGVGVALTLQAILGSIIQ
jgi:hypothetical protein